MIIELAASKTAKWIKETSSEKTPSYEVLEYGFKLFYNSAAIILISLLYGLVFNQIISVIGALFSFALLRFFSGGRHVNSSDHCVAISVGLIITITLLSLLATNFISILCLISLILVLIFSPYNIESQLKIFHNKFYTLKIISCLVILANLLVVKSEIASVAFLFQSLSLIRWRR